MRSLLRVLVIAIAVWVTSSLAAGVLLACLGIPAHEIAEVVTSFGYGGGVDVGTLGPWTLNTLRFLLATAGVGCAATFLAANMATILFVIRFVIREVRSTKG